MENNFTFFLLFFFFHLCNNSGDKLFDKSLLKLC